MKCLDRILTLLLISILCFNIIPANGQEKQRKEVWKGKLTDRTVITEEDLAKILVENHKWFMSNTTEGQQADLSGANLGRSNLSKADYTVHVVEPVVTNHLILPGGPLPPVCKRTSRMEIYGCRGQYEPTSFVVTAAKLLEDVRIEVDRVRGPGGMWSEQAIDVRMVKEYYRGTLSGGAAAMPTLLVHDEGFLAIEPAPTDKDPDRMTNVAVGPLRDTDTLQPIDIAKRKQFWVTVRIPQRAKPGDYETTLRIVPQNSGSTELTLSIHVYPFDLLPPMIEYSIYYPAYLKYNLPADHRNKFGNISAEQMLAEFRNMAAHGLSNPNIYDSPKVNADGRLDFAKLNRILDLREQASLRPRTLYLVGHPLLFTNRPLSPDELRRVNRDVSQINAWARSRGYDEVFYMAADEWWGERLLAERDSMIAVNEAGGKVFTAVMHTSFYDHVGDVLTRPVLNAGIGSQMKQAAGQYKPAQSLRHMFEIAKAGSFERLQRSEVYRKVIDGIHRQGRKIYTYMNPTAGVPLPDLHRRNTGLGMWRVGFDGTMTWAYTHIHGEKVNQAMEFAMVFRTEDGVLDTVHWEGFREGVDDLRYLTTLLTRLNEAMGRFPDEPVIRQTYDWLAEIDVAKGNLDTIRREIAQHIMAVLDLGYREMPADELLAGINLEQINVVKFPEPWRFKPDPKDVGVKQQWFDPNTDITQWAKVRTNIEKGWEKQGFSEEEVGYGWYRAALPAMEKDLKRKFRYLFFEAVDEDCWVYLNGRPIFEHSFNTTGLVAAEIWLTPFSVPLTNVILRGSDALAVRVHNSGGMGGIWKPVHLILSDQELNARQLHAITELHRQEKNRN